MKEYEVKIGVFNVEDLIKYKNLTEEGIIESLKTHIKQELAKKYNFTNIIYTVNKTDIEIIVCGTIMEEKEK